MSWWASPDLMSVAIVAFCASVAVYGLLRLVELYSSPFAAEGIGDLLLAIPLGLGVVAGVQEIAEVQRDREQLGHAISLSALDDDISIALAGVRDILNEQAQICGTDNETRFTRNILKELDDKRKELEKKDTQCPARALNRCDPLTRLVRDTLMWSSAPSFAASIHSSCDVRITAEFLRENALIFQPQIPRHEAGQPVDRLRELPANLSERHRINMLVSGREPQNTEFRLVAFWFLVFAAAVEVARLARKFKRS